MAGGAETPNIAALPAIARLGTCESPRGPDADRHVKRLIQFAVEGACFGADLHPQPPAPETRAPPKNDRLGQFSEAGSSVYNALVFGHLQRFKRYPSAARGKSGTVVVRFVLNRAGDVIESAVTKSSGNDVLDREAIAILQRASPFPAFPAAKPGTQDTYIAPVSFAH
jgi:TonB family protein